MQSAVLGKGRNGGEWGRRERGGPARQPGSSSSQALGHPGTAESCGKVENGVVAHRLDLAQRQREKEHSAGWVGGGESPWLVWQAAWLVETMAGSAEKPSVGC